MHRSIERLACLWLRVFCKDKLQKQRERDVKNGSKGNWELAMTGVYVILVFIALGVLTWLADTIEQRAKQAKKLKAEYEARARELDAHRKALDKLFQEKSKGFPWLARAFADYSKLKQLQLADALKSKKHPALRAAEVLRSRSLRLAAAEKLWRVFKYRLEYYEALFPWLIDFQGEDLDDLVRQVLDPSTNAKETDVDPVRKWVTEAEFASLSSGQRNQLALDRYLARHKRRWEIGRDYERYIGYLLDTDGWDVAYHGIVEGVADMGRDLIAKKDGRALIVQCKCWSAEKEIHEKHVCQLFGTITEYEVGNSFHRAEGWLVTSTRLSNKAKQFAEHLGIEYTENYLLKPYPLIKCNVSHRDGTKIYHLPMDQQYDTTKIDEERRECYVATVAEAESLGFRRAWRWHGMTAA